MARALVTGASRGLGRALVVELAGRGMDVVATARRRADLADLPAVARLALDVTSDESVAAAAAAAGPIDVLVNNAAITVAGALEATPPAVALGVFDTNVVGPLRMLRALLPGMRARGRGTVVHVSAAEGRAASPLHGAFAASKRALEALSETLALEVAPFGIRVLVVHPGAMDTEMPVREASYGSAPYARLERAQGLEGLARLGAASPACMARVIADAIEAEDSPLRVPAGEDAASARSG